MEKIAFLYVSQIFPGKIAHSLNYPQPWIKPDEPSLKISIDVSFGLIIQSKSNYRVDVDLFFGEEKIEFGDEQSMQAAPIVARTPSGDEAVSIENISLMNIVATKQGMYKVGLSLHAINDDQTTGKLLHRNECFFFLSNEWRV